MSEFDFSNARWNIPLIGSDIANIGRVIELVDHPCSPTPSIWVKAAWSNVPFLIWDLVKPDVGDIIVGAARRGRRIARRARMGAHARDRGGRPGAVGKAEWAAFRIVGAFERIGWAFLVADATENFAINWLSTAYTYAGCTAPGGPWAALETDPHEQVFLGNPRWTGFPFQHIDSAGLGVDATTIFCPAGVAISVSLSINLQETTEHPELPAKITGARILKSENGIQSVVASTDLAEGAAGVRRARLTAKDFRNTAFSATYTAQINLEEFGWVFDGGSHMDATGDKVQGVFLDP